MNQESFQESDWYRAITLTERIASLSLEQNQKLNIDFNADLAQRRLQSWNSQSSFTTDSYFAERLATDGITEREFLSLLGESIEAVKQRCAEIPTWLVEIAQAFSEPDNSQKLQLPEKMKNRDTILFLYLIEPLISQGRDRLSQEIAKLNQEYSELPFESKIITEILLENLLGQLLQILNRTLVLELNVARLQGLLEGNTPQERFYSFVEHLRKPEVRSALLQEYPVLARQTTICLNHWLVFSLEFLQHLCADWDELGATFSPKDELGGLVELQSSASDKHRRGRSVLIAKFSSGLQLVYKPRSLSVEVHFQQLLNWLNQHGNHSPFRTLKILDRQTHGWAEFVKAESCTSQAEIQRFYERQGGYLALLYALQATDFHSENLIAAGEHPILIDLESLFDSQSQAEDNLQADQLANEQQAYSVLRIGLLPERIWINHEFDGIDISGLGGKGGQLTPDLIPYWEDRGTDKMRIQRKRMEMPKNLNRPTLDGEDVNLLDYRNFLIAGFTNIYQLLLSHQDELLSPEGPIATFAEDEVRAILRPTRIYALLLSESFHPDLLRDALDRDRHFDKLWLQVKHQASLKQLIPAEREDLLQGDIPLFTTYPNSRDLWSSSGQQIRDFFPEPSINMVYRRLKQLDEKDMNQQLGFISASLATVSMDSKDVTFSSYAIQEPKFTPDSAKLLTAACAVGDRLEQLAVRGEKDVSWIGLSLVGNHKWILMPLGINLYNDLPGIALFLAYLGKVTNKERYTNLAKATLITIRHLVEKNQSYVKSIGAFNGWGGVIYTLTHLAMLWEQPELLTEAEKIVELLPQLIEQDRQFDIIGGAAGCIGSLLALYKYKPDHRTLAAAIKCGEQLVNQAQPMKFGIGWSATMAEQQPLAGFSHGGAGIAWALLELASLTGDKRFQDAALGAIEYERSLFHPEVKNWLDLRKLTDTVLAGQETPPINHMCAWCHGAPGIGLARLRSLPHLDNVDIRSEINTALETTLSKGFGNNHSLCHGDLGNLELLLQASITFQEPQWKTQVNRFAAIILESIEQHGWLCGVPLRVETPGLMTGLAGIGYGLLRLAAPKRIPSVLVLEAPKVNSKVNKSGKLLSQQPPRLVTG